jgi:hypothetical protein
MVAMNILQISWFRSSRVVLSTLVCAVLSALHAGCDGSSGGGGGGDGGSGGASVCEAFVTDPPETAVTVRLVNNSLADLYVGPETAGGCGDVDAFTLQDADGQPVAWRLGQCGFTCEAVQTGACGCTADCQLPVVWRITAGGALEVPWNGTVFTQETMPDECYDEGCGVGGPCAVERKPEGKLLFQAAAWTEVTGTCSGSCTCTPDATGSCMIGMGDAAVGGTGIYVMEEVDMLGSTVELVFQ